MIPEGAALLVDGNNLTMRAVKALEASGAHLGEDVNTGPAHVVAMMFGRYIRAVSPALVMVAWDCGYEWRSVVDPNYKANRRGQPDPEIEGEDGPTAFSLVQEFLALANVSQVFARGYEADDVIAYYVRRYRPAVILSGDKDLLQLVGSDVIQLRPQPNLSVHEQVWGPEQVQEKFGCPPEHLSKVMALSGDESDGIVGVRRVGIKTAVKYLSQSEWSLDDLPPRLEPYSDQIRRNFALIDLGAPPEPLGLPRLLPFAPTRPGSILWQDLGEWCSMYGLDQLHSAIANGNYWEESRR